MPRPDQRPDPDQLLAKLKTEEARQERGQLKIFLGFAPGVGKTYAMLQEALVKQKSGVDVIVGVVETHGRVETQALLEGLSCLPKRSLEHHGIKIHEFDLDAALVRHPGLILVDELAHTNAPGSRHPKRWQDVEELLHTGIHVYTALNVQHLESLNDVVAQITGIVVRETVPDTILELAGELELVDLSPEELLERLREGKVYVPEQAARAVERFFQKGNLIALRELSLRRTAVRVDAQMRDFLRGQTVRKIWRATERLLVCVSPSPFSASLIRATRRMAEELHAEWIALYVETAAMLRLSQEDRDRAMQNLRLAGQLGAKTATISGDHPSEEILAYARGNQVTKLVVGKPLRRRWKDRLFGSVVDELIWNCGDIDVYVITGDQEQPLLVQPRRKPSAIPWRQFGFAFLTVAFCTAVAAALFRRLDAANLIMVYLIGVVVMAATWGRSASILTSVLSVAAFDFFFVNPYLSFSVSDTQYLVTFAAMLLLGVLISDLTARIQSQVQAARKREREITALYNLDRELSGTQGLQALLETAVKEISAIMSKKAAIFLANEDRQLYAAAGATPLFTEAHELAVAQWAFANGQSAGRGTDTLPGARARYVPLRASRATIGVLGLELSQDPLAQDPDWLRFQETVCNQAALAIEREQLAKQAHHAQLQMEAERMRNALLSSVSHDLRTPLTVIAGSADSLMNHAETIPPDIQMELLQTIHDEAEHMEHQVRNLLEMSRLQSGALVIHQDWHFLNDIVGSAVNRMERWLLDYPLTIQLPADLPMLYVDEVLLEQVLINLLENAVKYTKPGTHLEISARLKDQTCLVEVADGGRGLSPGSEQRIFERFSQEGPDFKHKGVGLGLAICRGIIQAHQGEIWACNREGGGAVFAFTLPLADNAPNLKMESMSQIDDRQSSADLGD